MAAVKKPTDSILNEALDKLVIISPDKRTYDSITSVMLLLVVFVFIPNFLLIFICVCCLSYEFEDLFIFSIFLKYLI